MDVVFHTAETYFRRKLNVAKVQPALAAHLDGDTLATVKALPPRQAPGVTVEARVNHGRWIVDCPFCASAQLAAFTDRRFFCADCRNVAAGGAWLRVVFPSANLMQQIEMELAKRPRLEVMNWRPGETVATLQAENADHGVD